MSRRARVLQANVPAQVIQRGNNRQACFFAGDDYHFYLQWLEEYAKRESCRIHAYILMTNHVHLLLTTGTTAGPGWLMKRPGQRYLHCINRAYQRSGTLWEGRYRSCLMQQEDYVLGCYRYIELNPVRASMVEHPAEYRWSSERVNAQNKGAPSSHRILYTQAWTGVLSSDGKLIANCFVANSIPDWSTRYEAQKKETMFSALSVLRLK